MNIYLKRAVILIVGWGFVILGILGLFLPLLQGILFLLVGLSILSTQYAWARRWLAMLSARFPKISRNAAALSAKVAGWLRQIFCRRASN